MSGHAYLIAAVCVGRTATDLWAGHLLGIAPRVQLDGVDLGGVDAQRARGGVVLSAGDGEEGRGGDEAEGAKHGARREARGG